jgi:hypothetical protein
MTSPVVEGIGITGFVLNVVARVLLAHRFASGWMVMIVGTGIVLAYNIWNVSIGNIVGSSLFTLTNIYGWHRWKREQGHVLAMIARRRQRGPETCIEMEHTW